MKGELVEKYVFSQFTFFCHVFQTQLCIRISVLPRFSAIRSNLMKALHFLFDHEVIWITF